MFNPIQILVRKISRTPFSIFILSLLLTMTGIALLYDAGGGKWHPYAQPQAIKACMGIALMWLVALTNVRTIFRQSYFVYVFCLILLLATIFFGHTGMGAQRWLNLGAFLIQPSELTKIAVVLALARFFHSRPLTAIQTVNGILFLIAIVAIPTVLIASQPDLGTAVIIIMLSVVLMFAAGMSNKIFISLVVMVATAAPLLWHFFLREYQKQRIITFLNPENDPLGTGYHIIQSKIAIGSAGIFGKGFLQGTQSHLQFLPEKHTDFIFTLLSEDFGLIGGLVIILMYMMLIFRGMYIAIHANNTYSALVIAGIMSIVFFHAVINIAMVTGLMPVVGVPLPFISYGGTSLMTLFIGMGIVMSLHIHRDVSIPHTQRLGRSF
jgi:rod shape determining protein RodA